MCVTEVGFFFFPCGGCCPVEMVFSVFMIILLEISCLNGESSNGYW